MKEVDQSAAGGPYNIVFILTDQERRFRPDEIPKDYRLPAHERLVERGVVFENHRINSCLCTSSRSVIYTGRHIQHTKMFDNTNFPWMQSMSTDIRRSATNSARPATTPPTRANGTSPASSRPTTRLPRRRRYSPRRWRPTAFPITSGSATSSRTHRVATCTTA